MDLSFQLLKKDRRLRKIYYIYPFNTLVEQNLQSLRKVFGRTTRFFRVLLCEFTYSCQMTDREKKEEEKTEQTMYYQKRCLIDSF